MDFEYQTKQEADAVALSLKHLLGTAIKHIKTEAICNVKDVYPYPKIIRSDGADNIKGYDVRISFGNQPFTTNSKALEVAFII